MRAVRVPEGADAGLRGHRALRPHVGAGVRRRAEGDVQLHRPLRPAADAATRGDGADLPRLPRERDAARAAAREAVHDRADVPLRRARQGPLPRALAGVGGGDRLRRPVDRRRADPALRHAAATASACRRTTSSSTRSAAGRAAPRISRRCRPGSRTNEHRLDRGDPREGRDEPSARLRQLPRQAGSGSRAPSTRRRRSGSPSARSASCTLPPCGPTSTHGRRLHARSDPRPRARLLHANDVGVHRPDGQRELDDLRRRPLRRARGGDRRPADPGSRLRGGARAVADRDGGRRCHRRRRPGSTSSSRWRTEHRGSS